VSVHIYDDMTLNALPCYFLTHEIHTIDVIHSNVALSSSSQASHTLGSTNLTITQENSIDGL